jgi:DNA mismatch repair protein MutL
MEREDAILAIKPFSTSKIKTEEDLYYIKTLGFRGEALSSIVSVSRAEIKTKPEFSEGTFLRIEGGEIKEITPWEGHRGTSINIYDLFYNVPVRKKFLKSPLTEGRLISEFVEKIALAYPEISFIFIQDGRKRFLTSGNGNIEDVILELFGEEFLDNLIFFENYEKNYKISGYISKPNKLLSPKPQEIVFLNRRIIKNSSILQAIKDGYDKRLRENFYPFVILNLFVPYEEVDVNVHPTKREVKFHSEKEIMNFITKSIKEILDNFDEKKREAILPIEKKEKTKIESLELPISESKTRYIEKEKTSFKVSSYFDFKIIGQIFDNYLLIEYKDRLIIIDQHAAHERIRYEELKKKKELKIFKSNEILFPIIIEISKDEKKLLNEKRNILEEFSFYWEDFGPDHIRITSIPNEFLNLDNYSIENLFRELIHDLEEKNLNLLEDKILKSLACHSAIKSGEILIDEEIYAIVKKIVDDKIPLNCPHGRPILLEITKEEIDKKFQR